MKRRQRKGHRSPRTVLLAEGSTTEMTMTMITTALVVDGALPATATMEVMVVDGRGGGAMVMMMILMAVAEDKMVATMPTLRHLLDALINPHNPINSNEDANTTRHHLKISPV